jgi:hypothetical protein
VRRAAFAAAIASLWCAGVSAQEAPTYRPRQIVLSGGLVLTGRQDVGDRTITIQRNATGTPAPFTLLRAESKLASAAGVEGRVAFALTRNLAIEGGGTYATPQLRVTVSQDPELPGEAVASEQVQHFTVDVSVVYQLPVSLGRRARPYVIGGGGYLRQLHEGRLLVDTGYSIHLGGGVHYWLRVPRSGRRSFGLRGEARYVRRDSGLDFEDRARGLGAVSGLGVLGF